MKLNNLLCSILLLLAGERARAQYCPTNAIGCAQAVKIATHLRVGMSEGAATKLLEGQNGLKPGGGIWVGPHSSSTRFYLLSDGCFLDLALEPAEPQKGHADRWLRAASIRSNGVNLASIVLTNAP